MITMESDKEKVDEENNLNENETPVTDDQQESMPETDPWETKYNELNDRYLRLYSEFDNFRKRTAKEKIDMIGQASTDIIKDLLPVLDDLDRAFASKESVDHAAFIEGISLIKNKLVQTLSAKGLKEIQSTGAVFNTDEHEAITNIPAPSKEDKGKVIDTTEKGYFLKDKVIRYAKVVVGQ